MSYKHEPPAYTRTHARRIGDDERAPTIPNCRHFWQYGPEKASFLS